MASERQARRPTKGSVILILVVLGGVGIGMALIASALAELGIFQTVALTAGYLAGAIFGQAKDVANQRKFSGDLWHDLKKFFSPHGRMSMERLSSSDLSNGEVCWSLEPLWPNCWRDRLPLRPSAVISGMGLNLRAGRTYEPLCEPDHGLLVVLRRKGLVVV